MKSSRFGLILLSVLMLVAVLLALFGPRVFDDASQPSEQVKDTASPPATSAKLVQLAAKGVVESVQEIELSSQIKGEIALIPVDEGESVKAGQLLVRMNNHKIVAQMALAKAKLLAAQAELKEQTSGFRKEDVAASQSAVARAQAIFSQAAVDAKRQQRLLTKGASSHSDWEKAEEQRRVALAQLNERQAQAEKFRRGYRAEAIERARAKVAEATAEVNYNQALLEDYTVYSSIDGLIIQRSIDIGETVDIGTPLLTLINPHQLRIHAEVEEADVGKVTEGQQAEITTDNLPGKIFTGKVYQIFPTVNKKTQRTFDPMASFDINTQKVYIILDSYAGLVHGMTVTVRFLK